jgi:hypothetical protein
LAHTIYWHVFFLAKLFFLAKSKKNRKKIAWHNVITKKIKLLPKIIFHELICQEKLRTTYGQSCDF